MRNSTSAALVSLPQATFAYDHGEIKKLELNVKRKMQVLKMFSELKDFDYEAPEMSYDKKTGEIKIDDKKSAKKDAAKSGKGAEATKKVIASMDDLEREKKALYAEMGLDENGKPKNPNEPEDKLADKLKTV